MGEHAKSSGLPDLMTIYRPSPGTRIPRMMISVENGLWFSGRRVTDKTQRAAIHRLVKRMARANMVKITVWRWSTI